MNKATHDLITLSNLGLNVTALSSKSVTRDIVDNEYFKHKLHALNSCSYLKIDQE